MECITLEQILALTQNRLPASEVERIRAHLDTGCAACRAQQHQWHELLAATAGDALPPSLVWLTRQAVDLLSWQKAKPLENRLNRIPAILLVDSFTEGQLSGFRSTNSLARQMLYQAGDYNINLSISCVEKARSLDVMGQPVPLRADLATLARADVEMLKESIVTYVTKSNEFGAFILDGVSEGIYDLKIRSDKEELAIAELNAIVGSH